MRTLRIVLALNSLAVGLATAGLLGAVIALAGGTMLTVELLARK